MRACDGDEEKTARRSCIFCAVRPWVGSSGGNDPPERSLVPTDYAKMSRDLLRFYDFTNKTVLYVGAAGRQLLDLSTPVRKLIAIDRNAEDLRPLERKIVELGLKHRVEVRAARFEEIRAEVDVVYFEFCLHEMGSPEEALAHAKSIAPEVVVYDHSDGSEWVYYGAEEEKVRHSSEVMQRFGVRRRETFHGEQRFENYEELRAKVSPEGPVAIERSRRFADGREIVIPMSYELVLL